ncbi:unnamed protein product [Effrenium voratum]|nr:unnamed protein product [Effrenium voratum]
MLTLAALMLLSAPVFAFSLCPKDNPGCSGQTMDIDSSIWRAPADKYDLPGNGKGLTTLTELNSVIMGHAKTQIILAGSRLGLFEFLHKGQQTKTVIEQALGLKRLDGSTRPIDALLLGTTSLGLTLLDNRDKTYQNCPVIEALLVSGGWKTIADLIDLEGIIKYKGEFHYVESLKQDTNVGLQEWPGTADNLYARLPDTPGAQKIFYDLMNSFTAYSVPCVSNVSAVARSAKKMLDVGGGAGHGAIHMAKNFPNLELTLWDQHETVAIPKALIHSAGLDARIGLRAGSFLSDPWPDAKSHDAVLFMHQSVIWSKKILLEVFKKAFDMLPPGGGIVIFNSFANDDLDGPEWAGLDSVYFQSIPVSSGGYIWSMGQVEEFLKAVGFQNPLRHNCDLWTPHAVLEAYKPDCESSSCVA